MILLWLVVFSVGLATGIAIGLTTHIDVQGEDPVPELPELPDLPRIIRTELENLGFITPPIHHRWWPRVTMGIITVVVGLVVWMIHHDRDQEQDTDDPR